MASPLGLPQGISPPSSSTLSPSSILPRSFAAVLGAPVTHEFNPTTKFSSIEGIPFVDFESQDLSRAANSFRLALVMKFLPFQRPSVDLIRNQAKKFWGLHKEVKVSLLDARHVLLRFNHEQDMIKILSKESSRLNGAFYKIVRWSPDFDPKHDVSIAPVWVQLKDLPPHMYHSSFLRNISKPIGQYLRSDSATTTLSNTTRARFCVEVDLLKPLPNQIWVRVSRAKKILQSVEYENIPNFCNSCKMQGHEENSCHKLHPELKKSKGKEAEKRTSDQQIEKTTEKIQQDACGEVVEMKNDEKIEEKLSENIAHKVLDEMPDPIQTLENSENVGVVQDIEADKNGNVGEVGKTGNDPIEVNDSEEVGESLDDPTLVSNTMEEQESDEGGHCVYTECQGDCVYTAAVVEDNLVDSALDHMDQGIAHSLSLDSPSNILCSADDEILVPESQVELVKEVNRIAKFLEGGAMTNKQGEDLKEKRLVAKFSRKKVASLPPGPMKKRLEAMSKEVQGISGRDM